MMDENRDYNGAGNMKNDLPSEMQDNPKSNGPAQPDGAYLESQDSIEPANDENSNIDYSNTFRSLEEGDLVNGVVVHIDKEGVLVDVGTKSEGIIKPEELTIGHANSADDVVSVGDRIDVMVIRTENDDGNLELSKKRADFEKAWDRIQKAYDEQSTITAMVSDRVKGGLLVDLGIRGFIPGSHVGNGRIRNLDKFVGQTLPLKVLEVDRDRGKVVLSHKDALEEERNKAREETIGSLREGAVVTGIVRRITDYGAFVDLGGIDGLLHISEMSWTRINHPSEVVKVGQQIEVMVLKMDINADRVSLGLRQILPDPWSDVSERYKVGDVVKAPVSRIVPFGAFVQLEGGIEAIIPNSEQSENSSRRSENQLNVGEEVEARVIDIRPDQRKMTLSIKQLHEEKNREEFNANQNSRNNDTRTTIGDLIAPSIQKELYGEESEPQQEDTKTE